MPGKKKICIATPEFPPEQWGGLARTVGRVSRHAAETGLDVHVAHLQVEDTPVVLLDQNRSTRKADGITVHRIVVGRERMGSGGRSLWDCPHNLTLQMMYQSLELLHRHESFDLFHSFFLYPVGYVTGMLARRMGRPCIVTAVGNDVKKYIFSPEKAAVCRSGLENADRVVGLSRDLVEMADALTPVFQRARIIYNSVDIPRQSWILEPRSGRPFRVGSAGIFKYAKGLPYLLKAMAQLAKTDDATLELCGNLRESEQEVYRTMVQRTGAAEIITFREALPHNRIPDWLVSLDAFVLPSVSEGCPNILMEAMAAGVPSIATRTGAAEDLVEDGVSGILVPWGNSDAILGALTRLIRDPDSAASLGAAARARMAQFSAERERREWERLYRELIDF